MSSSETVAPSLSPLRYVYIHREARIESPNGGAAAEITKDRARHVVLRSFVTPREALSSFTLRTGEHREAMLLLGIARCALHCESLASSSA